MPTIFAVACGGAIGAALRYAVAGQISRLMHHSAFPYGTMGVNIIGSFLMGVLVTWLALKVDGGAQLRAFLAVGLLGGFTTFSSFSLEVILLIERGDWPAAGAYIGGSVLLSVLGLGLGMALARAAL